jgi:hypothetical protein
MQTGEKSLEFKITSAIINLNLHTYSVKITGLIAQVLILWYYHLLYFVENSLSEILVVRTILILKIINGIGNAISAAKNQYS